MIFKKCYIRMSKLLEIEKKGRFSLPAAQDGISRDNAGLRSRTMADQRGFICHPMKNKLIFKRT